VQFQAHRKKLAMVKESAGRRAIGVIRDATEELGAIPGPVRPENANTSVITGVSRSMGWRRRLVLGAAEVG